MKSAAVWMVWMVGCAGVMAEETSAPPARVEIPGEVALEVGTLLASGRGNLADSKWIEAATLFEKARQLQPSNNEAAFGLSAAYMELKRYKDALPLLEKLVKEVPDSPLVKNNLAWVLLHVQNGDASNAERAVKLARAAILDVPSDYSVWHTLGEAYYATGIYDKALKAAESGLRLSVLAGVTNSPCRELVARCHKALSGQDESDSLHP